ncbi:efflux RND transporter periplasmic adaptor subunit [candidate division KSB1 bacterium]
MAIEFNNLAEKIDRKILQLAGIACLLVLVTIIVVLNTIKEPFPETASYTVGLHDINVYITEIGDIKAMNNDIITMPGQSSGGRGGGGFNMMGGGRGGGRGGDRGRMAETFSDQEIMNMASILSSNTQILYMIPEGTRAQPGDTLLRLDITDLNDQLEGFKENLIAMEQALEDELELQKEQDIQTARELDNMIYEIETKRLEVELAKFGSANDIENKNLELRMTILDSLKMEAGLRGEETSKVYRLSRAQSNVDRARISIASAEKTIKAYSIIAEYPALVVYADDRRTGEKVTLGDKPFGGQDLLHLPDLSTITAIVYVNDLDRTKVWIGQKANVNLEAYPGVDFAGEVIGLSPISSSYQINSNVKTFEVNVKLDGTDERLLPGMTATVNLIVEEINDILAIPASSVYEKDGLTYVFTVDGNDLDERQVELGRRDYTFVEVLSGLEEDDEILEIFPPYAGYKIGQVAEWIRQEEAIALLGEHFEAIEELGIKYDYDRNRARGEAPRRGGGEYQSRDTREPTYQEIEEYLINMGREVTPENVEQAKAFLRTSTNAGRDSIFQNLDRALRQGRGRGRGGEQTEQGTGRGRGRGGEQTEQGTGRGRGGI